MLASASASRRAMLDAAGVAYQSVPASIDERALEAGLAGATGAEIAVALAAAVSAMRLSCGFSDEDSPARTSEVRPAPSKVSRI